jgi:tRNA(fMet)-specific endonuclease VapC
MTQPEPLFLTIKELAAVLRVDHKTIRNLRRLPAVPADVAVCSIVRSELMFGAARSRDPVRERGVVEAFLAPMSSLPFDDAAADRYATIRSALERQGMRIGAYDLQIAAIALSQGLTLVTHNTQEFSRVTDLLFEDWEA